MVQGKEQHFKTDSGNNSTTLIVAQDFKKKKVDHQGGEEMVQADHFKLSKKGDDKNANTTLTIVQDFPKKNADKQSHQGVEMVQNKEASTPAPATPATNNETEDGKIVLKIVQDFSQKKKKHVELDKKPTFGEFLTAKITRVRNFFSKLWGGN